MKLLHMKRKYSFLLPFFLTVPAFSQDVEMADALRSEGKIYVVVIILLVIIIGLIIYLVRIDRKTSQLEEKMDRNKHNDTPA